MFSECASGSQQGPAGNKTLLQRNLLVLNLGCQLVQNGIEMVVAIALW